MNHSSGRQCFTVLFVCLSIQLLAQDTRSFNQNASRSNHTRLSLSFSPVFSTPVNSKNDSLLFRGNGNGFNIGVDYYFDKIGIGFVTGFGSSSADDATINSFLKQTGAIIDQPIITKSKQQNMYLLLGPSVRFGTKVALEAHAKGGLFINNGGVVNIQQKGAQRAAYRNEPTDKAINPGFLTGLKVKYSTKSDAWSFGVGVDYMGTKTEMNNYDARRGGGIEPLKLSKNIKDVVAGLTITYNILSPRDHASGLPTGKRSATAPRDHARGLATGRRMSAINNNEILSPRDVASGLPTGKRSAGTSCGPVTQTITNADGTIEELNFACPDDAAAYLASRDHASGLATGRRMAIANNNGIISPRDAASGLPTGRRSFMDDGMTDHIYMNAMPAKQTQQANFGEKVNAGLHAAGSALAQGASRTTVIHKDLAARNVIAGKIIWTTSTEANGITTNKTTVTTARQTPNTSFGARVSIGVRDAANGKEAAIKKYGIIFADQGANKNTSGSTTVTSSPLYAHTSVTNNPLYEHDGGAATNPLFESSMKANTNPLFEGKGSAGVLVNQRAAGNTEGNDQDCDGFAELNVTLVDANSGATVATTKTERCGDFFFAHVPDGEYLVRLSGAVTFSKGYDIHTASTVDLAGVASQAPQQVRLQLYTQATGEDANKEEVFEGEKTLQFYTADENGDNIQETHLGNIMIAEPAQVGPIKGVPIIRGHNNNTNSRKSNSTQVIETIPGQPMALVAGNPIGGIIVKGGKNPGGAYRTVPTNENGEFTFDRMEAGDYTLTVDQTIFLNDESIINVNNSQARTGPRTYTGGRKNENVNTAITENPLYNDNGKTGNNPLYGAANKTSSTPRTYSGGRKNENVNAIATESPLYSADGNAATNQLGGEANRTSSTDTRTYTGGRKTETVISDNTTNTGKGKIIRSGDNGMMQVTRGESITFSWDRASAKQGAQPVYQLQVWQLMNGQTAKEAMLRNVPIIRRQLDGGTEYTLQADEIGPCKPPYLCDFIWTIQAIGTPGDKYETQADPSTFRIIPAKQNPPAIKKTKSSGLKDTLKTQV